MGRSSRTKGARGEREAAAYLTDLLGVPFERSIGQTRRGGDEVPDIVSARLPDLHVEVKRTKRNPQILAALRQAVQDAGDLLPLVLSRRDREGWTLTIRADDLPRLLEMLCKVR